MRLGARGWKRRKHEQRSEEAGVDNAIDGVKRDIGQPKPALKLLSGNSRNNEREGMCELMPAGLNNLLQVARPVQFEKHVNRFAAAAEVGQGA
jgi:hypothetical protein